MPGHIRHLHRDRLSELSAIIRPARLVLPYYVRVTDRSGRTYVASVGPCRSFEGGTEGGGRGRNEEMDCAGGRPELLTGLERNLTDGDGGQLLYGMLNSSRFN